MFSTAAICCCCNFGIPNVLMPLLMQLYVCTYYIVCAAALALHHFHLMNAEIHNAYICIYVFLYVYLIYVCNYSARTSPYKRVR